MNKTEVSIIILTKNAAGLFRKVLDGIFFQNYPGFETIIIDSGSVDDTLTIAKKYHVKIVNIKEKDFGHGKTRNLGARLAGGKYVVYLTQDAVPQNSDWLAELVKPLKNKSIAGVYGRQVPPEKLHPVDMNFYLSLYADAPKIWTRDNSGMGDNVFSSVSSAIRKEIILKYPFPEKLIVSEDYAWAFLVLQAGYKLLYNPRAKVIHAHAYNLLSLFKRNFDIGISYKSIYSGNSAGFFSKGLNILSSEIKLLKNSGNLHYIPSAIFRAAIKYVAINMGKHGELIPKKLKKNYISNQRWYWQ